MRPGLAPLPTILIILAALTVALSIASSYTPLAARPIASYNYSGYYVAYYASSPTNGPYLLIRVFYDGSPVPFNASVFAFTRHAIYTIGYFKGSGYLGLNLALVKPIMAHWYLRYNDSIWPSLIVAVSYVRNGELYSMFIAIPVKPSAVVLNKPFEAVAAVNINDARPVKIRPINNSKNTGMLNQTNANLAGIKDPYGYEYIGSCMGNTIVQNNPPYPGDWILENCQEFEGPIPQFFVGWSSNVISASGITGIGLSETGYVQAGSGTYGVVNRTTSTGGSWLELVGPLVQFSQNMNIQLLNGFAIIQVYPDFNINYGSYSCEPSETTGALDCYVNTPGILYTAFDGYIAVVSYYFPNYNIWANGTYILGYNSTSYPGGSTLYLTYGIDTGSGPITAMFTGQSLTSEIALTQLDGAYFNYATAPSGQNACSNSPNYSYSSSVVHRVEYTFSNVITSYNPNPVGIAFDVGSALAPVILDLFPVSEWISISASIAAAAVGFFAPPPVSSSSYYVNTYVFIGLPSPGNYYNFYTTFFGTLQISEPSASASYYWPMGMFINESGYYHYNNNACVS